MDDGGGDSDLSEQLRSWMDAGGAAAAAAPPPRLTRSRSTSRSGDEGMGAGQPAPSRGRGRGGRGRGGGAPRAPRRRAGAAAAAGAPAADGAIVPRAPRAAAVDGRQRVSAYVEEEEGEEEASSSGEGMADAAGGGGGAVGGVGGPPRPKAPRPSRSGESKRKRDGSGPTLPPTDESARLLAPREIRAEVIPDGEIDRVALVVAGHRAALALVLESLGGPAPVWGPPPHITPNVANHLPPRPPPPPPRATICLEDVCTIAALAPPLPSARGPNADLSYPVPITRAAAAAGAGSTGAGSAFTESALVRELRSRLATSEERLRMLLRSNGGGGGAGGFDGAAPPPPSVLLGGPLVPIEGHSPRQPVATIGGGGAGGASRPAPVRLASGSPHEHALLLPDAHRSVLSFSQMAPNITTAILALVPQGDAAFAAYMSNRGGVVEPPLGWQADMVISRSSAAAFQAVRGQIIAV